MIEFGYLGETVDQVRDLRSKVLFDLFGRGVGIFDDVVKETGGDADWIQVELGQDVRNFERMNEIRLSGLSGLAAMLTRRKQVGSAQKFLIGVGMVLPELLQYRLEANLGCAYSGAPKTKKGDRPSGSP